MESDPIAFFITWTVYGTYLPGDIRGWKKRRQGNQTGRQRLAEWHRERLNHDVITLTQEQRIVVKGECEDHCQHRGWHLWKANPRSNHVHVVVTANGYGGKTVRDQLKANCTRGLRERWPVFRDRPVWTTGGDWDCVNSEEDLQAIIQYVDEAQDRMGFDQ